MSATEKTEFICFQCGKKVLTSTLSLIRTRLCDDDYMKYGIAVPKEFWIGNTADQQSYMTELGLCLICNKETTKQCKLCLKWNCRPTEWSGDCMEKHLMNDHGVLFRNV